jgi:hypothetical protein
LLREFPNPEREGCPGNEILKGIACHTIPLAEAEPYLEHLTSCSPCYRDFSQLREAQKVGRVRSLIAIAATILLIASIAGWALVRRYREAYVAQTAVLDLRNWSVVRGVEPNLNPPPLDVRPLAYRVTILLPLGSAAGKYETRIIKPSGELLLKANGEAKLEDGVTSLRVALHLRSLHAGSYVLQIRRAGSDWNSYALIVE